MDSFSRRTLSNPRSAPAGLRPTIPNREPGIAADFAGAAASPHRPDGAPDPTIVQRPRSLADNQGVKLRVPTIPRGLRVVAALTVSAAVVVPSRAEPPPDARGDAEAMIGRSAHFDFEDAERLPIELPTAFVNLGPANSLAPFGEVRLSDEIAAEGRWSLAFTLDGESLIAGTRPGVLPIFPRTDYEITVRVRSRNLDRARARLVGRLYDAHGAPIDGTMAESAPITSEHGWSTLSVLVPGSSDDATHLGIELQVLQPQHWRGLDPDRVIPVLADVDGIAWFDDLVVRHRPAISISTAPLHDRNGAHEFIAADQRGMLHTEVRDLTSVALDAEITLTDYEGRAVPFAQRQGVAIGRESRIALETLPAGWYEALLDVRNPTGRIGAERLTFAVLPPRRRGVPFGMQRLGVVTPWLPTPQISALPRINSALAAQSMTIELWNADAPSTVSDERIATLRRVIQDLLAAECALTFSLTAIPEELASAVGLDPPQILELLARPAGAVASASRSVARQLRPAHPAVADRRRASAGGDVRAVPRRDPHRARGAHPGADTHRLRVGGPGHPRARRRHGTAHPAPLRSRPDVNRRLARTVARIRSTHRPP